MNARPPLERTPERRSADPGRGPLRTRAHYLIKDTVPAPVYQATIRSWYELRRAARRNPGHGRLTPDFIIIGAAKAGTTSLYASLSRHPFVAAASLKEVHYFDYNYYRGEDWYRRHFPLESQRLVFAAEHGRPFLTGEASPSYLAHHWAAQRIAKDLPNAKLVVSLRNPIDRAYSQFHMRRRDGEEPTASFGDAVAAEERRLAGELARTRTRRFYNSQALADWSYLQRGLYAEQLQRWFGLFGRDQFHVTTLEQLAARPRETLDEIHEFLGLPPHSYGEVEPLHRGSYDAVEPEVRARLARYFRSPNERLYELLGRDLGWENAR